MPSALDFLDAPDVQRADDFLDAPDAISGLSDNELSSILPKIQSPLIDSIHQSNARKLALDQPFSVVQPSGRISQQLPDNNPEVNRNEFSKLWQVPSDVSRAALTDALNVGDVSGNLTTALKNANRDVAQNPSPEPLPIDIENSKLSENHPVTAMVGKVLQGGLGSVPYLGIGALPSWAARLASAGFTVQMIKSGGKAATDLGDELGKNPEDRNMDTITSSVSDLTQSGLFSGIAGKHALQKIMDMTGANGFSSEQIKSSKQPINNVGNAIGSQLDQFRPKGAQPPPEEVTVSQAEHIVPPDLESQIAKPTGQNLPMTPKMEEQLKGAEINLSSGMKEKVLGNKIKSPLAFQRVFPNLNLSLEEAQSVLNDVWNKNDNVPEKYLKTAETSPQEQGAPLTNKGGAQENLSPEQKVISQQNNSPENAGWNDLKTTAKKTASPEQATGVSTSAIPPKQEATTTPKPVEPVNENTTGIAHRVSESRGIEAERGEGLSPEEAVKSGRERLAAGENPQSIIDEFNKTLSVPKGAFSLLRAKVEQMAKATDNAYDKFGKDSPEHKLAKEQEEAWIEKIKPLQTEWARGGHEQQGEVETDTGDFHSLRRIYSKTHEGKEMPDNLVPIAKKIAGDVKKSDDHINRLNDVVIKAIDSVYGKVPSVKSKSALDKGKIISFISKQAEAARQRIKERSGRLSAGLDPTDLADHAIIGAEYIARGVSKFTDWSTAMLKEIGNHIRPHLAQIYQSSKQKIKEATDNAQAESDLPSLKESFTNKKDNNFTPDEVKSIWQQAKSRYLTKGITNFDKIRYGLADDLGLTPEQVVRALQSTQRIRVLTDAMWKKQAEARVLKQKAQLWIKYSDDGVLWREIQKLPDRYFGLKVAGHGLVWVGTHTPLLVLDPLTLPLVLFHYGKGFNNLWSKSSWQRYISDIQNDSQYNFWKRRGLAIDVDAPLGEYAQSSELLGKFGRTGNRAFDAMKGLRLTMAKKLWDAAPDSIKNDKKMSEDLASWIVDTSNHVTGALTGKGKTSGAVGFIGGKTMRTVFFAPKLYVSRFAALFDAKALAGFRPKATPVERYKAKVTATHAGAILGLWGTSLLVNQAILSMTGSDKKINFFTPSKSDFLNYKIGNYDIGIASGITGIFNLAARLYNSVKSPKIYNTPSQVVGSYLRGKLSPIMGEGVNVATGKNLFGRPLPEPVQKVRGLIGLERPKPNATHRQFTSLEYASEELSPIPVSEALQNFYSELENGGFNESQSKAIIKSIGSAVAAGATGFKVREEANQK